MNRKMSNILTLFCAWLSTQTGLADLNVDRNQVLWPFTFEGNDLPDNAAANPAWSIFDLTGSSWSDMSDGDIYSMTTMFNPSTQLSDALSWQINDPVQWSTGSTTRTVEFRVRVLSEGTESFDGATTLTIGMNGSAYDFRMWHDKVAFNGRDQPGGGCATGQTVCGGPIGEPEPANVLPIDLTEFHTFRITVDQNSDPVWKVYVDNSPTPAMEKNGTWFEAAGFDKLVFGDVRTGSGDNPPGGIYGMVEWDFISWHPNEAIPPSGLKYDRDNDGDVDGADFLIIQRTNPSDIEGWASEYGLGGAPLVAGVSVPEMGTFHLINAAAICFLGIRPSALLSASAGPHKCRNTKESFCYHLSSI